MFAALLLVLSIKHAAPLNPATSCDAAHDKEFCQQILPMIDSVDPHASFVALQALIAKRGWPTPMKVGQSASNVAMKVIERASAAPKHAAVARMWRGRVPTARANEYEHYLDTEGVQKLRAIKDNLGAQMFRRDLGDNSTEFVVISYWPSRDAIRAYAGADIEKVHDLPRDKEFLIDPEKTVRHYDIISDK